MSYVVERPLLALLMACLMAPATAQVNAGDDASAIRVLLAADLETTLSSQMNGTLGELKASFGQPVGKSSVLARFDCAEPQARAKVAGAELTMARQNLDAKRNLRKLEAVGDLEVAMASTEVKKTEGALALAQAQNAYCQVQAPFAGRVAKVHVKPFQTVVAGTPLFDLVSDGALKVRLNVPSNLLPGLKTGNPLQVSIHETGKAYPAHLSAINARVDAVAQTVELEARLDAEYPELIAGMSGTATLSPAHD
ncbi:efflux RND transporter periplasmic adaptor subunit [Pseudomonas sp. NPDC087612]|uniref:efflux RND transporter periplasmic adaptor subunit n=1 Tax=unclassified Pseudomonas TaxID=196821 RepID=UPI0005EB852A|nr:MULTISPECIES: efflux RND transporter periplasmic adaptor subunit [unclassified Pseudomonas]KJK19230.1 RND transporter [Pseudomonas sp. 2(2015)]QVM98453.1 efflux RND transporter periplasmic adaptor subunit [Pseudomonas sp. SORT22]UVL54669.1 efflux RND transporter periplasmic adaptor subunit [Pseudomonas sp. B21-035]SDQ55999.1 RND family efflux transporter, MFP subunit [Pseudomonas sp. UC 17F4]